MRYRTEPCSGCGRRRWRWRKPAPPAIRPPWLPAARFSCCAECLARNGHTLSCSAERWFDKVESIE